MKRLGLTEGQRYTVVVLAVVAVLLSTSLTRLNGRVAELISAPGPAVTTTTAPPATTRPPVTTPTTSRPVLPPPARPTVTTPLATSPSTTRPAAPASTTSTTLRDRENEPDVPCPADGAVQGLRQLFESLDDVLGGILPTATLTSVVAIVTGCSQTDPLVLVLAALTELGEGLPDLGLGFLEFPVLPFLDLPDLLIELLQPLRPLFDPVCDLVATAGLLLSQVGPSYPYPLDATFAVSLFYLNSTCGQIQKL